ncbi:hypothetical protein LRR81_13970 [Metabacillus sp. GX 13764]|uniref:hypothetical protein n=1 Tax=Metabacillus kandeliae TaxID=2900151 RepID=UPI001E48A3AF|nr:hypothetical protein [Metabacillus kandeliae]MCD7035347.1 hypothetical protein [Metabacillus kandeliae]
MMELFFALMIAMKNTSITQTIITTLFIYDYEVIRYEYSHWVHNGKDELLEYESAKKKELVEGIESVLDEYDEYARLAGSDGVFSYEIYQYLLAFEELKEEIIHWVPRKKRRKDY